MFRCLVQCTVKIIVQLLYRLLSLKETHEHHDSFKRLCRWPHRAAHRAPCRAPCPPPKAVNLGKTLRPLQIPVLTDTLTSCLKTKDTQKTFKLNHASPMDTSLHKNSDMKNLLWK